MSDDGWIRCDEEYNDSIKNVGMGDGYAYYYNRLLCINSGSFASNGYVVIRYKPDLNGYDGTIEYPENDYTNVEWEPVSYSLTTDNPFAA